MKKFKSRKDLSFKIFIFGLTLTIVSFSIFEISLNGFQDYTVILYPSACGFIAFLLWIYYGTSYALSKDYLEYRSGPIRGRISILSISKIVANTTMWSGLKPATAKNGLIIKFNRFNEIYISPETNETFIIEVLRLNPNIEILSEY